MDTGLMLAIVLTLGATALLAVWVVRVTRPEDESGRATTELVDLAVGLLDVTEPGNFAALDLAERGPALAGVERGLRVLAARAERYGQADLVAVARERLEHVHALRRLDQPRARAI